MAYYDLPTLPLWTYRRRGICLSAVLLQSHPLIIPQTEASGSSLLRRAGSRLYAYAKFGLDSPKHSKQTWDVFGALCSQVSFLGILFAGFGTGMALSYSTSYTLHLGSIIFIPSCSAYCIVYGLITVFHEVRLRTCCCFSLSTILDWLNCKAQPSATSHIFHSYDALILYTSQLDKISAFVAESQCTSATFWKETGAHCAMRNDKGIL